MKTIHALCFNGINAGDSNWNPLQQRFKETHWSHPEIILHSMSNPRICGYTIWRGKNFDDVVHSMSCHLHDAYDKNQGPVPLIAHSFGERIATEVARRSPDKVSGIISMNTVPPNLCHMSWSSIRRLMRFQYISNFLDLEPEIHPHHKDVKYIQDGSNAQITAESRQIITRMILGASWGDLISFTPKVKLTDFKGPVAMATTADDHVNPLHIAHKVAAWHGITDLHEFPKGGHYAFARPEHNLPIAKFLLEKICGWHRV